MNVTAHLGGTPIGIINAKIALRGIAKSFNEEEEDQAFIQFNPNITFENAIQILVEILKSIKSPQEDIDFVSITDKNGQEKIIHQRKNLPVIGALDDFIRSN